MSYWSQADLEGLIGKDALLAIFDDGRNGWVNQVYLSEVQALADAQVDGTLARVYPGPFPIVQIIPAWTALASRSVGAMVTPTVPSGFAFRCVGAPGTSAGTEPTWPAQYGQMVVDGTVTWLCASLVPELVRQASLLWGRALAYERHPDYVRRYGDQPRKMAEEYLENLIEAKAYLEDLIGSPLPSNVGGLIYAQGPRMTIDDACGNSTTGDF